MKIAKIRWSVMFGVVSRVPSHRAYAKLFFHKTPPRMDPRRQRSLTRTFPPAPQVHNILGGLNNHYSTLLKTMDPRPQRCLTRTFPPAPQVHSILGGLNNHYSTLLKTMDPRPQRHLPQTFPPAPQVHSILGGVSNH